MRGWDAVLMEGMKDALCHTCVWVPSGCSGHARAFLTSNQALHPSRGGGHGVQTARGVPGCQWGRMQVHKLGEASWHLGCPWPDTRCCSGDRISVRAKMRRSSGDGSRNDPVVTAGPMPLSVAAVR